MSSIKFNYLTKEVELKGSESFIESIFNEIQDLLDDNIGVKEMMVSTVSRKPKATREPMAFMKMKESEPGTEIKGQELSEVSQLSPAILSSVSAISHGVNAKRPPLRKYIRKEGVPGHQRIVVEIAEQKPREISIASLREKFGLSESKIGGIDRDAEKHMKGRRRQISVDPFSRWQDIRRNVV
jgi:hypothetical protein